MGVLCVLGFHIWEYITTSVLRFRGCQRCGKWQKRTESNRKWKTPSMNIEWGHTTWDEMKARIYEEAEG